MTQEQITQKRNEFHSSFFGELVPKLERELLLMNGKAIVKDPTFKSDYELADEIKTYEDIRDPNQQQIETLRTLKAEQTRRGERYKKIEDVLLPLARKLALKEIAVDELPVEYAEEAKIYASEKLEDFMRLKDVEIVDKLPTPKKISKKRTGKSNASLPNTPVGPTSPSDSSASSSTSSPTSPPIRKGALTDGK